MSEISSDAAIYPVILCGGVGSRLWPKSRAEYPKQLQSVLGDRSLLQETVLRVVDDLFAPPVIVCSETYRFAVAQQLEAVGVRPLAVVLEPVGRNSAPAAAVAAMLIRRLNPAGIMLVMPSDHLIADPARFRAAVGDALAAARDGRFATFGLKPSRPETGYGYIKPVGGEGACLPVERFVEKPDLATAEQYVDGGYLWNSGIFMFPVAAFLAELRSHAPAMVAACEVALARSETDGAFLRLDAEAFRRCPADSIDYAVMERTEQASVVPVDMGWSDLGSWQSVWELSDKDGDGNAVRGDVVTCDVTNSLIHTDDRLTTVIGLDDVVVVATHDAVLVANRHETQRVKEMVDTLKALGRREVETPLTVARPWGNFTSIDNGHRFQVKRIVVSPGGRLSLQMHHHRAEHWIVVYGTARVTRGEETFLLFENQSTYIPKGVAHRLENPGKVPLQLIEVQSGSYLGEDDIVRFKDDYGRTPAGEALPMIHSAAESAA